MVEHHYELKHMMDIERRQIEEIDKLREKFKDSENKTKHLTNIRKALEDTIEELKSELAFSRKQSADRKSTIELRVKQTDSMKGNMQADVKIADLKKKGLDEKKDVEIKKVLQEIEKQKAENAKLKVACDAAQKGTNALREALNMCTFVRVLRS